MKFKLDENLPKEAAAISALAGHSPIGKLWIVEEGRPRIRG
jgi:hypothetical protein